MTIEIASYNSYAATDVTSECKNVTMLSESMLSSQGGKCALAKHAKTSPTLTSMLVMSFNF
jgi:hypothetical protein